MLDDRDRDQPAGPPGPPGRAVGSVGAGSHVTILPAEIDIANADQVRADLLAVLDRGFRVVIADMSRTTFCDCAGVVALLAAGSYAARGGAQLRIVARASAVLRTFQLTGLLLALPVYQASSAALREPGTASSWQDSTPWQDSAASRDRTGDNSTGPIALSRRHRPRADAAGSCPLPGPPLCP